jgi:hypothetical protein
MLHLTADRLAALADEHPTADEAEHLALCAACARERGAFQTLVAMAHAERTSLGLPLTRWESVAAALAQESEVDLGAVLPSGPRLAATPVHRTDLVHWTRRSLRIAAGLLLVAGGVFAGRASVSGDTPLQREMAVAGARGDTVAGNFLTVEEARVAQQHSEMLYRQAAAYLAQHDSTNPADGNPIAYRSRLAALDQVISTTRAAMREAPHDPVINGYYLNTLGQREATLRQLNTVLPASLRLNSF